MDNNYILDRLKPGLKARYLGNDRRIELKKEVVIAALLILMFIFWIFG